MKRFVLILLTLVLTEENLQELFGTAELVLNRG